MFLQGIPREGLRPSQHLAKIRDLIKDVKLDDLIKEMVLRDLPTNIRHSLAERADLSADDAAKAADHYFDKNGRPKHQTTNSGVNSITDNMTPTESEAETNDEDNQVNAVGRPRFRGNMSGGNRRPPTHQQRSFAPAASNRTSTPAFSNKPNYSQNQPRNSAAGTNNSSNMRRICRFHLNYADAAVNCEPGCQYKPKQHQNPTPTGNGPAGRRR